MEKIREIGVKAQSHIETILSFVIFAGFLFTLLIFFNPISQKSTSTAVLDLAERQIIDNLSISHEKISLILKDPAVGCFKISNSIGAGTVVLVKDSKEQIKDSKIAGGSILVKATDNERYYVIYYNSTLNSYNAITSCTNELTEGDDYSFGLHDKDKMVLYDNLIAFNNSYYNNYESLKTSLGLKSDFAFIVYNQSNAAVMIGDRPRPSALNLLSRNIPLMAVNRDMNRTDVILNIKVWE